MDPIIEVISIGTELLNGTRQDGDFDIIAKAVNKLGYRISFHTTVSDESSQLKDVFEGAIQRAHVVISTGGLGPTEDDITRAVVSDITGKKLVYSTEVEQWIRDHFAARNCVMGQVNLTMAYIPQSATALKNDIGNAPGIKLSLKKNNVLFLLPGPPREMIPLFEREVVSYLKKTYLVDKKISNLYKITGLPESAVQQKITDTSDLKKHACDYVFLASPGDITLKVTPTGNDRKAVKKIDSLIKNLFGDYLYSSEDILLESVAGRLLTVHKKSIAVAESCTGGLLAHRITNIVGSSDYFLTGVVAYSNKAKCSILRVSQKTINSYGAVSMQTAKEMAKGVRNISRADIGVSITGIAGPTGGTKEKPVGLVYFGLASEDTVFVDKKLFTSDREGIKQFASQHGLDMIRRYLIGRLERSD
ncbi:competence/damage-inducible protein A [Chlamydiota bacterium]